MVKKAICISFRIESLTNSCSCQTFLFPCLQSILSVIKPFQYIQATISFYNLNVFWRMADLHLYKFDSDRNPMHHMVTHYIKIPAKIYAGNW